MNRARAREYRKRGGMDANAVRYEINKEVVKLKAEMEERMKADIGKVVNDYTAALLACLHDKLGFGPKRAQRFANEVTELFDNIRLELVSIEDVKEMIAEEMGIVIE